ncbi:DUF6894 family protein [Flaviflagellibacter deserti]|jgi:hypothetical protein|uniref:DUF6894 family protein n=1 Tax=Flaviflagellibacter deserti TaxID=2267266 RepID=A0ABV9Z4X3_9HYPH
MQRFFFHVIDGTFGIDSEGTELLDLDAARSEAIRTAGEILRHAPQPVYDGTEWQMHVTDESTRTLLKLTFKMERCA